MSTIILISLHSQLGKVISNLGIYNQSVVIKFSHKDSLCAKFSRNKNSVFVELLLISKLYLELLSLAPNHRPVEFTNCNA